MIRTLVLSIFCLIAFSLSAATEARQHLLHFAYADYELETKEREALSTFLADCDRTGEHEFLLQGHTDSDGNGAYNEALGLKRALAVKTALLELGVPENVITIRSFGERDPVATNGDPEGMQRNRRVELTFNSYRLDDLDALNALLGNDRTETFTLRAEEEAWLRTRQGAVLHVPANAFMDERGRPVNGAVDLTVTEALKLEDMLAEGLSTVAGERLLETGGMLRMEANANGEPITLDPKASVLVSLPTTARAQGMQLFLSPGGTDWTATGQQPLSALKVDLPPRPSFRWPRFRTPVFTIDVSGQPRRPALPAPPSEPKAPRRESYTTPTHWYQFLVRDRIRLHDEERFMRAMADHQRRVDAYERKLRAYEEAAAAYPEHLATYEQAMTCWTEEEVVRQQEEWMRTVYARANDEHQRRIKAAERLHANALAEWNDCYKEQMDRYAAQLDSLGVNDVALLNTYLFTTNTLGWINCDRFMDTPEAMKHDIIVQDADTTDKRVFLVFSGIKSVTRMTRVNEGYLQNAIPRNQPVALFAYAVKDGKPYVCRRNMTGKAHAELDLRPTTVAELRRMMQELQSGS